MAFRSPVFAGEMDRATFSRLEASLSWARSRSCNEEDEKQRADTITTIEWVMDHIRASYHCDACFRQNVTELRPSYVPPVTECGDVGESTNLRPGVWCKVKFRGGLTQDAFILAVRNDRVRIRKHMLWNDGVACPCSASHEPEGAVAYKWTSPTWVNASEISDCQKKDEPDWEVIDG